MKPRRGYCRQEGRFGSKPGWLRQSISGVASTNCAALTRTCFSKSSQHADWPKGARRSMSSGFRESPSASASRYHKGEQLENVDSVRGERRGVIDRDRYATVQFLFLEILPKWETSLDVLYRMRYILFDVAAAKREATISSFSQCFARKLIKNGI